MAPDGVPLAPFDQISRQVQPLETKASSRFHLLADRQRLAMIPRTRANMTPHTTHALWFKTTCESAWTPNTTGRTTTVVMACAPRTVFDFDPSNSPKTTMANPAISDSAIISISVECGMILSALD